MWDGRSAALIRSLSRRLGVGEGVLAAGVDVWAALLCVATPLPESGEVRYAMSKKRKG